MIVVLKYNDFAADGKNVFRILADRNIKILKTKQKADNPVVTIEVNDQNELNQLLSDLNTNCIFEVSIVQISSDRKIYSFNFINFVAFVICTIAALYQGYCGNMKFCLLEVGLAILNLPQSIKWVKDMLQN